MFKEDAGSSSSSFRVPALSIVISLILIFILAQAGTWPGIGNRPSTLLSLGLIALITAAWIFVRQHHQNLWYRTPLDLTLPFWALAFVISTTANPKTIVYSLIGLWFVGLYIVIWYITFDILANKWLDPERLLDGFFISGVVIVASALLEFMTAPESVRVSGLMQNPNILGAFMVLLIPLTAYRILNTNGVKRISYGLLLVAVVIVLVLSQSRGGILGVCCSFGLVLFRSVPQRRQRLVVFAGGLILGISLLGLRGDSGRMSIYEQAADILSTKLLTGQGLFTFRTHGTPRRLLLQHPPTGQNLHAHNIAIQIVGELGIVGLVALSATIFQFIRQKTRSGIEHWCLVAVTGLLVQQLVDFTIMTPSIALCTILILSIASLNSDRAKTTRHPVWLIAVLVIVLVVTGIFGGPVPRYYL